MKAIPVVVCLIVARPLPAQVLRTPARDSTIATAVQATCPGLPITDGNALLKAELRLADSAYRHHGGPSTWVEVGCVRASLAELDRPATEEPLMLVGTSWAQGAANALLMASREAPARDEGTDLLTALYLHHPQLHAAKDAQHVLLAAGHRSDASPYALRGCAVLSFRAGDTTAARLCANRGLASGADSTWALISLTRLDFGAGDSALGEGRFELAARAARNADDRSLIDWNLEWFLSPKEYASWQAVQQPDRVSWLRNLLGTRDVIDGRPPFARLAEHFKRLAYVESNFSLSPAAKARDQLRSLPATVLFPLVKLTERRRGQSLDIQPVDPYDVNCNCDPANVPAQPWREYNRWQVDFDDRGIVWMRYGAPDQRIRYPAEFTTREIWRYVIAGVPLIVNFESEAFTGTVEATRLVSGVLGGYMCGVDIYRCGLSTRIIPPIGPKSKMQAKMPGVRPEQVENLRQADRAEIVVATTGDDNSVRSERNVSVISHLYRLWNPQTAVPVTLGDYAVRVADLRLEKDSARTARFTVALRQWDPVTSSRHDTTLDRHVAVPASISGSAHLTGYIVAPSSGDVGAWSVIVTQKDGRSGRTFRQDIDRLGTGSVTLSDLVLGVEGRGLQWSPGTQVISIEPSGTFDRRRLIHLYYQVHSRINQASVVTTVSILKPGEGKTPATTLLQVGFGTAVHLGVIEVDRGIDVSQLPSGEFEIQVSIADAKGNVLTRRSASLHLEYRSSINADSRLCNIRSISPGFFRLTAIRSI